MKIKKQLDNNDNNIDYEKKIKDKSQQHPVFPGGYPSKYEPGSTLLNFEDRTRTGFFSRQHIFDLNVYKVYILNTASTGSGVFFMSWDRFFLS